jgi:hypothetical protein
MAPFAKRLSKRDSGKKRRGGTGPGDANTKPASIREGT